MPTWTTPGTYTWTVPAGVTEITAVDVAGGQGGDDWSGAAHGGKGGRAQAATVPVNPGDVLTIVVGGQGSQGVTSDDGSGAEGTGAAGGNGITTTAPIIDLNVAGEGRSGGGGGGGASAIMWRSGSHAVTVLASGGGGAGGSWPGTPADKGGNGGVGGPFTSGSDNAGGDGEATTPGPGGYYYAGSGGRVGFAGAGAGWVGQFGRTGSTRNGGWCTGGRTGGGGGGGGYHGASGGGGGRELEVSGAGGGGSGGEQIITSYYGPPTGTSQTDDYQSGAGYVTFTYTGEFATDGWSEWSVGYIRWGFTPSTPSS